MFKNYIITAWRNLLRFRKITLIQMLGLSLGMAACIVIFQYVKYEHSYEHAHEKHELIYRMIMVPFWALPIWMQLLENLSYLKNSPEHWSVSFLTSTRSPSIGLPFAYLSG